MLESSGLKTEWYHSACMIFSVSIGMLRNTEATLWILVCTKLSNPDLLLKVTKVKKVKFYFFPSGQYIEAGGPHSQNLKIDILLYIED